MDIKMDTVNVKDNCLFCSNNLSNPATDTVKSLFQKAFENQEHFTLLQDTDLIGVHKKCLTKFIDDVCQMPFDLSIDEDYVNYTDDKNGDDDNNEKADADDDNDHGGKKDDDDNAEDNSEKDEYKEFFKNEKNNLFTCMDSGLESALSSCEYFGKPTPRLHWLLDYEGDSFNYFDSSMNVL